MSDGIARPAVGQDELGALKALGLAGARTREVKVSCADLADRLDASTQTASRRLQALDDADYLEREHVSDGQWVAITETGERALKSEYEDYRRIFEERAPLALSGVVTSGMGEGRHYISLSGYMAQFRERLGYEPFPGTLNLSLTERARRERSAIDAFEAVPIDGWEDEERTFGPATCYPAALETTDGDRYEGAHVIVPVRTHHDEDQIELIAPDRLRDELALEDGDEVTAHVTQR
jgi:riboflavin kinase